jgi:energy-coupling factor transporter ATP-binding protein EcfA2
MAKRFNVTGLCFPKQHYMVDTSDKFKKIKDLIDFGEYFTINRPRQYGKTTTLQTMGQILRDTGEYIVFNISFEGVGDDMFKNETIFAPSFLEVLADNARYDAPEMRPWLLEAAPKVDTMKMLANALTDMCHATDKKVVVMIDEVDKSSNNQLFISFIAMLRDKYLERGKAKTFHSVVLAGVHDVKSLKLKLRPEEEKKFNSPWNIAVDFKIDMNFNPLEIESMLKDYVSEKAVVMDTQRISERLFFYTSGYPYLVSKLCKIVDEDILPTKDTSSWTEEDLANAVQMLLRDPDNVNFNTLFVNLEHNPDLYNLVAEIIFDNAQVDFDPSVPHIHLGILYGLFAANEQNRLVIHNRIYRERIANYMVVKWQIQPRKEAKYNIGPYNFRGQFVDDTNNTLDMVTVLIKFQLFMREHNSAKNREFLEKDGRLLFMAFLRPVLNGSGYDFKEPQVSDEKRLDVVITFYQHRYLAELKLWYGEVAHQKGLKQLSDYMDTMNLKEGYLVIFNHNKKKTWKSEWIQYGGKKIFAVWV